MAQQLLKVVYLIGFRTTHKVYIGSSARWPRREKNHKRNLENGNHPNCYLQRAFNRHGRHGFQIEVLETFNSEFLMLLGEAKWMAYYHATNPEYGYNLVPGPTGSDYGVLGLKWTIEQKKRHADRQRVKMSMMTGEDKTRYSKKMSNSLKTRWRDEPERFVQSQKSYTLYSPNGDEVKIINLRRFCQDNNLDFEQMQRVTRGIRIEHNGWKLHPDRVNKVTTTFDLIGPGEERVRGTNLREFCRQRHLSYDTLIKIVNRVGTAKTCQGWRRADMSFEEATTMKTKNYILITPEGKEIVVNNFSAFCRKHGLNPSSIRRGCSTQGGWKLKK